MHQGPVPRRQAARSTRPGKAEGPHGAGLLVRRSADCREVSVAVVYDEQLLRLRRVAHPAHGFDIQVAEALAGLAELLLGYKDAVLACRVGAEAHELLL